MNEKDIIAFFTYLSSQQTSQKYLKQCYQKLDGIDAEKKSYDNCNMFMYCLEHAIKFFENGRKTDAMLKPILLFYGMVHLLKAALLTKRPNYPESSKILAHGASSRKRKKKDYCFMNDEVKVQKNGLFPYFSEHLYSTSNIFVDKFKMEYLLSLIPEMSSIFSFQKQKKWINIGAIGSRSLTFPNELLDNYHLTANAFVQRIKPHLPKMKHIEISQKMITIELSAPISNSFGPFFFHETEKKVCFPAEKKQFIPISEVMVHYLLLYNLSMLSRYETEWWGDLLVTKAEIDYPFIIHFLQITSNKVPLLLGKLLYDNTI